MRQQELAKSERLEIRQTNICSSTKNPPTLGVLICPLWSLSSLCVPPLSRCLRCAFHRCPRCLLAQVPRCAKEPEKGILCRGPNLPRPPPLICCTQPMFRAPWPGNGTPVGISGGGTPLLSFSPLGVPTFLSFLLP